MPQSYGDTDHEEGDRQSQKRVLGRDEERLACFFKSGLQVEYAMARGEGVDKT